MDLLENKTAKALFGLSLLVIAAIWVVNSGIAGRRELIREYREKAERTDSVLGRLISFEEKNHHLFAGLLTSSVMRDSNVQDLKFSKAGRISFYSSDFPKGLRPWMEEDSSPIERFGQGCEKIQREISAGEARVRAFNALAIDELEEGKIQKFQSDHPEAYKMDTLGFVPHLLSEMGDLESDESWKWIASWIATGDPIDNGWGYQSYDYDYPVGSVSYGDPSRETEISDFQILQYRIGHSETPREARKWLMDYAEKAGDKTELLLGQSKPNVAALGVNLTLWSLLTVAGLLIVFLLVKFGVERSTLGAPDHAVSSFPQYSSPDDPLGITKKFSLMDLGERGIWLFFLFLPASILYVGAFFRYTIVDVLAGEGFLSETRGVSGIVNRRSLFSADLLIDSANVFALILGLTVIAFLVKGGDSLGKALPLPRIRRLIVSSLVFSIILFAGVYFRSQPSLLRKMVNEVEGAYFDYQEPKIGAAYLAIACLLAILGAFALNSVWKSAKSDREPAATFTRRVKDFLSSGFGNKKERLRLLVFTAVLFGWLAFWENGYHVLDWTQIGGELAASVMIKAILATFMVSVSVGVLIVFLIVGCAHRLNALTAICGIGFVAALLA